MQLNAKLSAEAQKIFTTGYANQNAKNLSEVEGSDIEEDETEL